MLNKISQPQNFSAMTYIVALLIALGTITYNDPEPPTGENTTQIIDEDRTGV